VDQEVKRILEECAARASRVIRENRVALDALQRRLVEKEILEKDEVARLVSENANGRPGVTASPSAATPPS